MSSEDKVKDKRKESGTEDKPSAEPVLKCHNPYDPRFPNQNQTRACYQHYLDYHRCLKVKDESFCHWYQLAYREMCPTFWTDKWDEQRANGIFAGRI